MSTKYYKGPAVPIDELRQQRDSWRKGRSSTTAARSVTVTREEGPELLVKPKGRPAAVVVPGVVELPVYGNEGRVVFRYRVQVRIDVEREQVVRGEQTIIPLSGRPGPAVKELQQAQLGTAWRQAVEWCTLTDHPKAQAAMAERVKSQRINADGTRLIDAEAERKAVADAARKAFEAGSRASTEDLGRVISRLRRTPVSGDVARRRKAEARARGLLPPAGGSRRPPL